MHQVRKKENCNNQNPEPLVYKTNSICSVKEDSFIFEPLKDLAVLPYSHKPIFSIEPLTGLVAASHHVALRDVLNGYCLDFLTTPKDFNK